MLYALYYHLRYYPHGANSTYSRFKEVIRRPANVHLPLAVYQFEAHDRLADEAPLIIFRSVHVARAMHVGRQDARDALGIVRRQRLEGKSLLEQQLHDVPHAGPTL